MHSVKLTLSYLNLLYLVNRKIALRNFFARGKISVALPAQQSENVIYFIYDIIYGSYCHSRQRKRENVHT